MSVAGIWSFWFKQLGMVAPNNQFFGLVVGTMWIQIKHDLAISEIEPLPIRWKPCLVDRFFRAESQPIPRYIWLTAGKLTHLFYLLLAHYQTVYLWFNGVIRLGVNPDSSKSVIWGDCGSGISSAMRNAPAYVLGQIGSRLVPMRIGGSLKPRCERALRAHLRPTENSFRRLEEKLRDISFSFPIRGKP